MQLVRRTNQIDELKKRLNKAISTTTPQIAFVVGEAGSGKSTLVSAFVDEIELLGKDPIIAFGECNSHLGYTDPYLPFREILKMLIGDVESKKARNRISEPKAQSMRKFGRASLDTLIEFAPDLIGTIIPGGTIIGHVVRTFADKSNITELIEKRDNDNEYEEVNLNQNTIFSEYTTFLEKISQDNVIIIVIEDLQWADQPSINLLFHIFRQLKTGKVFIIGTYRPDDVNTGRNGKRHPLEAVLNEIKRTAGDVWIDLDDIPEENKRQFVDQIVDRFPNKLDAEFRDQLFSLTEGNALFVTELINDMKERKDIIKDAEGDWVAASSLDWTKVPIRVEAVIEERVARLADELKDGLTIASVEGELFTAQVLGNLQDIADRDLFQNLSDLLEKRYRIIEESGERQIGDHNLFIYKFNHIFFQQHIYNELGTSQRRFLHRQVAEALETLYQGYTEEVTVQLARHFEEAHLQSKAASYYKLAGDNANEACAYTEAIELYNKAIKNAKQDQLKVEIMYNIGKSYYALGNLENAKDSYEMCIDLANDDNTSKMLASCKSNLARTLVDLGFFDDAKIYLKEALKISRFINDKVLILRCLNDFGYIAYALNKLEESEKFGYKAINLASKTNSSVLKARTRYDLACTLHLRGKLKEAIAFLNEAIDIAEEYGHKGIIGYCLNELGWINYENRNFDKSKQKFQEGLNLAREISNEWVESESLNGLGFCAVAESQYSRGLEMLKKSLQISYYHGAVTEGLLVLIGFCNLYFERDQIERALSILGFILKHESSDAEIIHFARISLNTIRNKREDDFIKRHMYKGNDLKYETICDEILEGV